ncbi:MAG: hypothetical protein P8010_08550 [Desulfosarcinaceae bacterium]|jgi:hypothetical protein
MHTEYQVVYVIISEVSGELDIPFFSKLYRKNSARTLRGLGYRVAKLKIDVSPEEAKLNKYKKRRKKSDDHFLDAMTVAKLSV